MGFKYFSMPLLLLNKNLDNYIAQSLKIDLVIVAYTLLYVTYQFIFNRFQSIYDITFGFSYPIFAQIFIPTGIRLNKHLNAINDVCQVNNAFVVDKKSWNLAKIWVLFRSQFYLNLALLYMFLGLHNVFFMLIYLTIATTFVFLLASGITFFKILRKHLLDNFDLEDTESAKITNHQLGCI